MAEIAFYIFSSILLFSSIMVVFARNPVHGVLFLIVAFFNAAGLFILLGAEFLAMLLVIVYVGAVAVLFLFVVMMLDIVPPALKRDNFWPQIVNTSRSFLCFTGYFLLVLGFGLLLSWGMGINIHALYTLSWTTGAVQYKIGVSLILSYFLFKILFKQSLWQSGKYFFSTLPSSGIMAALIMAELSYVIAYWDDLRFSSFNAGEFTSHNKINLDNTHLLGKILYIDYIFPLQIAGLILLQAMIGAILLAYRKREGVKRQNIHRQLSRTKAESLELQDVPIGKGV